MEIQKLPYVFNILVLFSLVVPLLTLRSESKGALVLGIGSEAFQVLVGSFWSAVLIASVIGLYQPRLVVGLLLIQVIYKLLFLVFYVLTNWQQGLAIEAPFPMIAIFVIIVCTYPFFYWYQVTT